jgi:hypothetical protein
VREKDGRVAEAKACLQAESPREARHVPPFTSLSQTRGRSGGLVDMNVSAKARSNPPLRSIPGPQQPDAE